MVDKIVSRQPLSEPVATALRTVPRHVFVPQVPLQEAYRDTAVVTRRHPDGTALSSASAPWLVGLMLDQLEVRPGMRMLEVGAVPATTRPCSPTWSAPPGT